MSDKITPVTHVLIDLVYRPTVKEVIVGFEESLCE